MGVGARVLVGVMVAVLVAVLVALGECAEKTPKCSRCNWELTMKTAWIFESGTDCKLGIGIRFDDGHNTLLTLVYTSKNDHAIGSLDKFTFDLPERSSKVVSYVVAMPTHINYICEDDGWHPDWTELRNIDRPDQVPYGRCTYPAYPDQIRVLGITAACCSCYNNTGYKCEPDRVPR